MLELRALNNKKSQKLSHPDYTVGLGISPNQLMLADFDRR